MIVLVLGAVGVVLFVIGVSFALQGFWAIPQAKAIVPRKDYDVLEKSLLILKESEKKLSEAVST